MKSRPHPTTRILCLIAPMVLSLFASAVHAQDGSPPPEVVETKTLIDYYQAGGIVMHFLLLGLVVTLGLTVYLAIAVSPGRLVPKRLVDGVNRTMAERDIQGAYALCSENPCAFSHCLSQALLKVNFDRDLANKASMVTAAEDTLEQEETKLMVWINYLNTVSTLAPMIGLFGTVIGMITAFDALAAGKSQPADLAGGIGTAMLTTAGGLIVGIPAMFFYFFFRNRLSSIATEIQKNFSFAIDVLSGEIQLEGAAQTEA